MAERDFTFKTCSLCGQFKRIDEFHKDKSKTDLHCGSCKLCNKERSKIWAASNKARHSENCKTYYLKNQEAILAKQKIYNIENAKNVAAVQKLWRQANSERKRTNDLNWQRRNPDKVKLFKRVCEAQRRSQKDASLDQHSAKDLIQIYKLQKGLCPCCSSRLPKNFHADHVIPLFLGGSNDALNIQLLCPTCNLKKNKKHPIEFMQEIGFLL